MYYEYNHYKTFLSAPCWALVYVCLGFFLKLWWGNAWCCTWKLLKQLSQFWGAQLPMLLSPPRPFWSSPSTSVQVVPSTPGTSRSCCAPSNRCYCQLGLADLSQLFAAPSQPQSTSAGWRSAHFSSCIPRPTHESKFQMCTVLEEILWPFT